MGDYKYAPLEGAGEPAVQRQKRLTTPLLAVYSVLVTFALIGSILFNIRSSASCHDIVDSRQEPLLSDFKTSLRYHTEYPPQDAWDQKLYSGEPSIEVERAWTGLLHNLTKGYGVKITTDEADELGFPDYPAMRDGRVLSSPAVYHSLHCLRRIRQILYKEHYYADMTDEQEKDNRHHASHCLEVIRSSMVCNPDLTLLRVKITQEKEPYKAMVAPKQKCVDWESLVDIVNQRTA